MYISGRRSVQRVSVFTVITQNSCSVLLSGQDQHSKPASAAQCCCHGSVCFILWFDCYSLFCPFSISTMFFSLCFPLPFCCMFVSLSVSIVSPVSSPLCYHFVILHSAPPHFPHLVVSVCVYSLCLPSCLSVRLAV